MRWAPISLKQAGALPRTPQTEPLLQPDGTLRPLADIAADQAYRGSHGQTALEELQHASDLALPGDTGFSNALGQSTIERDAYHASAPAPPADISPFDHTTRSRIRRRRRNTMTRPDDTAESPSTHPPDPGRPIGKAARTRAARRPPPAPPKTRPPRRRNRLILLAAATVLTLGAAGYGASVLLRPPPPPPPPLVVAQPRSVHLDGTKACDHLTPTEIEAVVGPLSYTAADPHFNGTCSYGGKDGRQAELQLVDPQTDPIDPAVWRDRISGNSAVIGRMSPDPPHSCTVGVLLGLPPHASRLYVIGDFGVTCDQVVAAAAAVVSHLPPAG